MNIGLVLIVLGGIGAVIGFLNARSAIKKAWPLSNPRLGLSIEESADEGNAHTHNASAWALVAVVSLVIVGIGFNMMLY